MRHTRQQQRQFHDTTSTASVTYNRMKDMKESDKAIS
jgi:hypothetical protein